MTRRMGALRKFMVDKTSSKGFLAQTCVFFLFCQGVVCVVLSLVQLPRAHATWLAHLPDDLFGASEVPTLSTEDFAKFLSAATENMEPNRDFAFVLSGKVKSNEVRRECLQLLAVLPMYPVVVSGL